MSKHILILAHSENPPLAALLPMLERLGRTFTVIRMPFGETPPEHSTVDGLIILGAAASIHDAPKLSWLQDEMTWVKDFIALKKPIFGICFGCQMLAKLMGGESFKGEKEREFSYTQVTQTAKDNLFKPEILAALPVFQAHGDTYTLPNTATQLLAGERYPQQAAKFAEKMYGTQFHPEICAEIAGRWHKFSLERGRDFGPNFPDLETHIELTRTNQKPIHAWLEGFLGRLFKS